MLLDDLVDVGAVDVGVPDRLRVDHDAGSFLAPVQATRLVDAHLAGTGEAQLLHALLGVVAHVLRALVGAAGLAVGALVAAEEDVSLVVAHAGNAEGRPGAAIIPRGPASSRRDARRRAAPDTALPRTARRAT